MLCHVAFLVFDKASLRFEGNGPATMQHIKYHFFVLTYTACIIYFFFFFCTWWLTSVVPLIWEVEAGEILESKNMRPPGLHSKTASQKKKIKRQNYFNHFKLHTLGTLTCAHITICFQSFFHLPKPKLCSHQTTCSFSPSPSPWQPPFFLPLCI